MGDRVLYGAGFFFLRCVLRWDLKVSVCCRLCMCGGTEFQIPHPTVDSTCEKYLSRFADAAVLHTDNWLRYIYFASRLLYVLLVCVCVCDCLQKGV